MGDVSQCHSQRSHPRPPKLLAQRHVLLQPAQLPIRPRNLPVLVCAQKPMAPRSSPLFHSDIAWWIPVATKWMVNGVRGMNMPAVCIPRPRLSLPHGKNVVARPFMIMSAANIWGFAF